MCVLAPDRLEAIERRYRDDNAVALNDTTQERSVNRCCIIQRDCRLPDFFLQLAVSVNNRFADREHIVPGRHA